jgi:hypothetical protein
MRPTPTQTRAFFTIAGKLPRGIDEARDLLEVMTKTRSTRAITQGQMELVLTELYNIISKGGNEAQTNQDDNVIYFITADQRRAVRRAIARLKMGEEAQQIMSLRLFKKPSPETAREAHILLSELNKALAHRFKK